MVIFYVYGDKTFMANLYSYYYVRFSKFNHGIILFFKKNTDSLLIFFIIFLYTTSVLFLKNIPTQNIIVEKTINKILDNKSDPISIDNDINIYLDDYFKSINLNQEIILTNYHFLHMLYTPTISKIRKNLIFYDF